MMRPAGRGDGVVLGVGIGADVGVSEGTGASLGDGEGISVGRIGVCVGVGVEAGDDVEAEVAVAGGRQVMQATNETSTAVDASGGGDAG